MYFYLMLSKFAIFSMKFNKNVRIVCFSYTKILFSIFSFTRVEFQNVNKSFADCCAQCEDYLH